MHELLRANTWDVRGRDRDLLVDAALGVASLQSALKATEGNPRPRPDPGLMAPDFCNSSTSTFPPGWSEWWAATSERGSGEVDPAADATTLATFFVALTRGWK